MFDEGMPYITDLLDFRALPIASIIRLSFWLKVRKGIIPQESQKNIIQPQFISIE